MFLRDAPPGGLGSGALACSVTSSLPSTNHRFPGAAGQACYAPEEPQGALGQVVRASGGQPRAARQCGSFGGSAIQRKQDPFSSLLMAARDLGSRPPIVADVGGLEPSVPLVLLLVGESLGR